MSDVTGVRSSGAVWASGGALILSLVSATWLSFYPCAYRGVSPVPRGRPLGEEYCVGSVVSVNGPETLLLLGIPVVLSVLVLVGALRGLPWLMWAGAGLSLGFGILGALSIGIYFLPSAVLLAVAAALVQAERDRRRFVHHGGSIVDR